MAGTTNITLAESRAQPLAHSSYLGDERLVSSPLYEGFPYGGTTSMNLASHNSYVTHQQSSSPSLGNTDFMYGYQQIPRAHNSPHYTPHNMPSTSIPSYYGMPHTAQAFAASTASFHGLDPTTARSGMYEAVSYDHQAFQTSGFAVSDGYNNYIPHGQVQQQTPAQEYDPDLRARFDHYQSQTREIFTHVKDRDLKPTGSLLLQTTKVSTRIDCNYGKPSTNAG
ncbi:unnamed protein product [Aureobasidium vineae]|uniref:Uncharacterized protein n=1 Tax=Aureobasidium vineae TaxID=2773715 RepID=A0A9N8JBE8_9PEZI|nr:unnamed protein product [Aureobasidium vineae]